MSNKLFVLLFYSGDTSSVKTKDCPNQLMVDREDKYLNVTIL